MAPEREEYLEALGRVQTGTHYGPNVRAAVEAASDDDGDVDERRRLLPKPSSVVVDAPSSLTMRAHARGSHIMANWCNLHLTVTGRADDLKPFRKAAGALRGRIDTRRSDVFTEEMEHGEGGASDVRPR